MISSILSQELRNLIKILTTTKFSSRTDRRRKIPCRPDSVLSMITKALNLMETLLSSCLAGLRTTIYRYGPCLAIMRTSIRKYTAKLFAFTMMVMIGIWMYHGEASVINCQKKTCSRFSFRSGKAGTKKALPLRIVNHTIADALDWRFAICKCSTAVGELL